TEPTAMLARCLNTGFVYQGQPTLRDPARRRGEPTSGLPPTAFVLFLQNHDQVGNRAFGVRLLTLANKRPAALRAAVALQLLTPQIPLIFIGEECCCVGPFLYFSVYRDLFLAQAIRDGRLREFDFVIRGQQPASQLLSDPNEADTYTTSY